MPINTKMSKSGLKNVFKKRTTALEGRLNRAARKVNTAEADQLAPGASGLAEPVDRRSNRRSQEKHNVIRGNRRRH